MNHQKVVEGFVENLCTISDHVKDIQVDKILYDTDDMIKAISKFYSHIFLYLESVMDWILKKSRTRLIASFNENLKDRFENDIKQIRSSSDAIRNLAQQSSRAEVRYHRQEAESGYRDIRLGLHGVERQNAEIMHTLEEMKRRQAQMEEYRRQESRYQKQLGLDVKLFLQERFRHEQVASYSLKSMTPDQMEAFARSGLMFESPSRSTSSRGLPVRTKFVTMSADRYSTSDRVYIVGCDSLQLHAHGRLLLTRTGPYPRQRLCAHTFRARGHIEDLRLVKSRSCSDALDRRSFHGLRGGAEPAHHARRSADRAHRQEAPPRHFILLRAIPQSQGA